MGIRWGRAGIDLPVVAVEQVVRVVAHRVDHVDLFPAASFTVWLNAPFGEIVPMPPCRIQDIQVVLNSASMVATVAPLPSRTEVTVWPSGSVR